LADSARLSRCRRQRVSSKEGSGEQLTGSGLTASGTHSLSPSSPFSLRYWHPRPRVLQFRPDRVRAIVRKAAHAQRAGRAPI